MASIPNFTRLRPLPRELSENSGAMSSINSRPPRASLVNMTTNEEYQFLFNPQTIEEKIEAKYNRAQIIGLSHERLSFKNTTNNVVPIELYISQLAQDLIAQQGDSSPPIMQQKAWLQSLVYPASSQDFSFVGPPRVLFIWPRVARMIGRVTKVSFLHREFSNRTLGTIKMVARLEFEEDVEQMRLMEDVQLMGSLTVDEDV